MSYPINQKINPYQQQQLQQQQVAMGLNSPQLQNVDVETIKQNVGDTIENSNNIVTQAANQEQKDQQMKMLLSLPIWFGISRAMERFNKACATKVDANGQLIKDSSLLDKVRIFGDNLAENKIFRTGIFGKISEILKSGRDKWYKFVDKSPILYSVFKTPSKPKNSFPKMSIVGTPAEAANDATQAFTAYVRNLDGSYNEEKLQHLFGKNTNKADNIKALEKMCTDDYAHYKKILECCDNVLKVSPEEVIELGYANNPSPFLSVKKVMRDKVFGLFGENGQKAYAKLFGREIRFSEIKNKLEALKGNKVIDGMAKAPGKTALGRTLPKAFLRVMEGLTNGTAGGKMAIGMQAMCFADAIIRAHNAKKGDKGKTFIESAVSDLSYYLLMPLGLGIMYGAGGLKYIGMNKTQVDDYRVAVENFNKEVASGVYTNKDAYKKAKQGLKDMLAGSTKVMKKDAAGKEIPMAKRALQHAKNILYKPLKAAGRILTVGLETTKPYISAEGTTLSKIGNSARNLGHTLKVKAGVVRFPLYLMVVAPPMVNFVVKICHKIFGKPEKSILDEDKDTKKQEQHPALIFPDEAQAQNQQAQQPIQIQPASVMQPLQHSAIVHNETIPAQRQNLIDMYQTNPRETMIPVEEPAKRRYIPSSVGVKIDSNAIKAQSDKADAAFNKANKAEKRANQFVH